MTVRGDVSFRFEVLTDNNEVPVVTAQEMGMLSTALDHASWRFQRGDGDGPKFG
ncbi:hypothetical protein [Mycolicibacterium nivoides]|uniref:hypothetical protein n=1 Tax=Mycolicibacterium nivoides TaxID=2487344 RepID=UPI003C2D0403